MCLQQVRVQVPINLCTGDFLMPSVGVLRQSRRANSESCPYPFAFFIKSLPHFQKDHFTLGSRESKSDAQFATTSQIC